MNAVATIPTKSVTLDMANRYGMEVAAFEQTLRQTIMPMSRGAMMQPTREEFAAFLLVAREYRLNPITRQIYAFPKKGGGIIPVVSVDGWAFLINEHPAFDGMEFKDHHDDKGNLLSVTCRIFRKDRRMPVSVTEYLSECKRDTEPWAMRHRMLRHKSLIQCARYAFAFSGIYDEDEAEKFAAIPNAGGAMRSDAPPSATRRAEPVKAHVVEQAAPEAVKVVDEREAPAAHDADGVVSADELLTDLDDRLGHASTADEVEEGYTDFDAEALLSDYEGGVARARKLKADHLERVGLTAAPVRQSAEPDEDRFPGDDAIAANEAALVSADPFTIPASFADGEHYGIWFRAAIAASSLPEHEDRLRLIWAQTKPHRDALNEDGSLDNVAVKLLLADLKAAFERIQAAAQPNDDLPPPAPRRAAPAPQQSEAAPQADAAPSPVEKPAAADPVTAYTADMDAAFAAAQTKEEVDRFWFGTTDRRDEETGADEDQRSRWRLARNKAKSALPNAEG